MTLQSIHSGFSEKVPTPTSLREKNLTPKLQTSPKRPASPREDLFNKLYQAAKTQKHKQAINEQLRKRREIEHCTFRPRVSSQKSVSKENYPVYERLSSENKQGKLKYLEAQKKLLELQHCTFTPIVFRAHSQSQGPSSGKTSEIHSKLFKESELLEQIRRTKEVMYKDKELTGCTFKPNTGAKEYLNNHKKSTESISSRDLISDPCERLYLDYEKKSRDMAKQEVDKDNKVDEKYTFRPSVISKRKLDEINQNIPIHEKLYAKHWQRKQMLEAKRMELQLEEQRIQKFVSQHKENRQKSPTSINQMNSLRSNNSMPNNYEEIPPYERLHNLYKDEPRKKAELAQKVMKVFL